MMNKNMNRKTSLLYDLYITSSPSGSEYGVQAIVIRELNRLGIDFKIDKDGNIYRIDPGQIILSAHMDQIFFEQPLDIKRDTTNRIFAANNTNIGADDKNGIFIILQLLENNPELSFCFSTREETGGNLWYSKDIMQETKKAAFAIIFDRKGNSDIIGAANGYCSLDFETKITEVLSPLKYQPAPGVFSDADFFKQYINAVNLSCGYYNAHSVKEFTVWADVQKAIKAGIAIIANKDLLAKAKKNTVKETVYKGSKASRHYDSIFFDDLDYYGLSMGKYDDELGIKNTSKKTKKYNDTVPF